MVSAKFTDERAAVFAALPARLSGIYADAETVMNPFGIVGIVQRAGDGFHRGEPPERATKRQIHACDLLQVRPVRQRAA